MATALIVYLCMFIVGFVLIIGAFIFGGEHDTDHDVGHDFGHDHDVGGHDHGADGEDTLSPSVFSTKVMAFFLMGFGLGAAISHLLVSGEEVTAAKVMIDLIFGLLGGFALGWIGWWIIKIFMKQTADSNFKIERWVGVEAPLNLTINQENCGEMSASVDGQLRSLDVRSEDGSIIKTGTRVKVIRVDGQIGIVRKVS